MTPEQMELVRRTWERVLPIKHRFAELFYARLFEIDPGLRRLFKNDIQAQGRKLMSLINVAVASLDKLDAIAADIEDLGRRHLQYGVHPADYAKVEAALMWTMEQGLGSVFTPAAKQAWTETFRALATRMRNA